MRRFKVLLLIGLVLASATFAVYYCFSKRTAAMTNSIASWERKYFSQSDGEAFLFYVAFGKIAHKAPLESSKYRCAGIPEGFKLMAYDRVRHHDVMAEYQSGHLWEKLKKEKPDLASRVEQAPGCVVLYGSRPNPPTLDYLRDSVGLLTFFLDHGACAIYDPHSFHWWSPEEWREKIFMPAAPVPRHHVLILLSPEENRSDLLWIHTRGMRKFGRPDLSIRQVGHSFKDAVINMCNCWIEYQAFGGVIREGDKVRMASLPDGGEAWHGGNLEDPDFNNVHVEFVWPAPGLTAVGSNGMKPGG